METPMEGLKHTERQPKKQKSDANGEHQTEANVTEEVDDEVIRKSKADKRRAKREAKKAKEQAKTAKKQEKKARKAQEAEPDKETPENAEKPDNDEDEAEDIDMDPIDATALADHDNVSPDSTIPPSKVASPVFDAPGIQSVTSSISSTTAPISSSAKSSQGESSKSPPKPKIDQGQLKARLQARLDELRKARKVIDDDGNLIRTRQEMIDARRKKDDSRKANKKKLRQQAREEELREKELAISRGSPLMTPSGNSPRGYGGQSPLSEPVNNFSFGRMTLGNGQTMTTGLDSVESSQKRKGSKDPRAAMQAAEKRAERLAGMDAEKRADIEVKDVWLNAKKRVQGERVRDDTSLLKKALKSKDKQKKKSEKEWTERTENVAKGQAIRQKKREDNLQKRRDEKGTKKGKGKTKSKKPRARPGFEGSFKTGGKRK